MIPTSTWSLIEQQQENTLYVSQQLLAATSIRDDFVLTVSDTGIDPPQIKTQN